MTFKIKTALFCLLYLLINGCGVYSFTGASITPDIKTISIQYFYNDAGNGPPSLQQTFTEKIRDYYQQNTSLELVDNGGDLQLEGNITGYNVKPIATTASGNANVADAAGAQRLTITVKVSYANIKDETYNFSDKSFSFYDDFDPNSTTLTAVEDQLIETIFDQIVVDIFNASVANW
jgi:hypothetical protein